MRTSGGAGTDGVFSFFFLVLDELVTITLKNLCMHILVCQRPSTGI